MLTFIASLFARKALADAWSNMGRVFRWLFVHPMIALAIALGAWGMIEHRAAAKWKHQASKALTTLNSERAAATAARIKQEQHYKDLAHEADRNHAALVAQGDARLAAYIASHRLRIATQAHPASTAQSGNSAVLADAAAAQLMAPIGISEADLRICDANYVYARAAFDWAAGLNKGN